MSTSYAQLLNVALDALEVLSVYRGGLSLKLLADTLDVPPPQLRETLAAYDRGRDVGANVDAVLVFYTEAPPKSFGNEGDKEAWLDRHTSGADDAEWVQLGGTCRAQDTDPFDVLLSPVQIADLISFGENLSELEPHNQVLRAGLHRLKRRWFPDALSSRSSLSRSPYLALLRKSSDELRRVEITYANEWNPASKKRIIEPWQVRRTKRGFEVDAGPVHPDGSIRTFLLRNIEGVRVLDETFEVPGNFRDLINANRVTITARVGIPRSAERSYEALAESIVKINDDHTSDVLLLDVELAQPYEPRLAVLLLRAGPKAVVYQPADMRNIAAHRAQQLLSHHGLLAAEVGAGVAGR